MKSRLFFLSLAIVLAFFQKMDAQCTWVGPTSDNYWNNPSNWSCGYVPWASDAVIINGENVQVDAPAVIASLSLTNCTLTGGWSISVPSVTVSGNVALDGVTLYFINNDLVINPSHQLSITNCDLQFTGSAKMTVSTGATFNAGTNAALNGGAGLTNNGTFTKTGPGVYGWNIPFVNNGTMNLPAGAYINWNISGPNPCILGNVTGAGTLDLSGFGTDTIEVNGSLSSILLRSTGSGVFEIVGPQTQVNTIEMNGGTIIGSPLTIGAPGNLIFYGGIIKSDINVAAGAAVHAFNGGPFFKSVELRDNAKLNVHGTFHQGGYFNFLMHETSEVVIHPGGIMNLYGGFSALFSGNTTAGITNNGQVNKIEAGTQVISVPFLNNDTVSVQAGTVDINSTFTNNASGVIEGVGTINMADATYIYNGHVAPGLSPGTLNWTGNFFNNQLDIEIDAAPPATCDLLNVAGNITLSGSTLNVTEMQCVPSGIYDIIAYTGSRTGAFSTLNLPPGYSVTYDNAAKKVRLQYTDDAPSITCPADVSVQSDPGLCAASSVDLGTPVVSDNCPGATASNDAPTVFPAGPTNVVWTATDGVSQTEICIQVVTVSDTEPPVIECPADQTISVNNVCSSELGAWSAVSLSDDCTASGNITVTQNPSASSTLYGPNDTETVTLTAEDGGGNTADCNFTVTLLISGLPPETCNGLDDDCDGLIDEDGHPDLDALLALYNSTDGPNWFVQAGWADGAAGTDCNVCGWEGVTCDGNGRVTELSLIFSNLSGPLPVELANLTYLVNLGLGYNQLTGNIPPELGNLSNLVVLDLSNNQFLTGNIPVELGNLSNLQTFALENNQLTGTIPAILGSLTNLTYLGLSANQLSGNVPSELGNLSNLLALSLETNQLTGNIPVELGNLSNIQALGVSENQLTGTIPATLGNLTNLTGLFMSDNQLTGGIPSELSNLSLTAFAVSNNQLTGSVPAWLGNMVGMQFLLLYGNQLSGCFDPNLSNLCSVPTIDFSNNPGLPGSGDFADFCANGTGDCSSDGDNDGHPLATDCDDNNPDIHPGAPEICDDNIDNNCDGQVDENCSITISGTIIWEHDDVSGVGLTTVKLTGDQTGTIVTGPNGTYSFTSTSGSNFTVTPTKNINKLNGVSVADALRVQRHVAGIDPITDAYKMVAADVNKSNSVTTQDAVIILQSLAGNPAALVNFKTSWRFVPTAHTLVVPPWNFPEKITLTGVNGNVPGQDFFGIKTGDVMPTFANPVNLTSPPPLVLRANDRVLESGAEVVVEFKADQFDDLAAFQMALRFDPAKLQLAKIQPLAPFPLTPDDFGTYNIAEDEIRAVWSQAEGMFLEEGMPVFSLTFKVLQSGGKLSEVLYLDDQNLPGLAYNSVLAESGVALKYHEVTGTNEPVGTGLQLFQNRPNPFSGKTVIGFVLPEPCDIQLRIFDASGRMVIERSAQYPAGRQEETFDLEALSEGVLYYELVTPFGVLAKKMVVVKR